MPNALVLDPPRIRRFRAALDELGYDSTLRALRGSNPRVPHPPYAEFAATLRRVEPRRRTWFELLTLGRRVAAAAARAALGPTFDDLQHLGVTEVGADRVRLRGLGLTCYRDRYVLARLDPLYPTAARGAPDVYIGPSSFRLAAELPEGRRLDSVLDLCTGSGLLGIVMARGARRVVATDLLDDAVAAARFNAVLNGVEERLEVRQGDLFAPVRGERFDLVVFNAPFVAAPSGAATSVLAHGGEDGLDLLRPLLGGLRDHLCPGGSALTYLEGEGDRSGPSLERRLQPVAAAAGLDLRLTLVGRVSVAERLRQLADLHARRRQPPPVEWRRFYRERNATHMYAMIGHLRLGRGRVTAVSAIPRG